MTQGATFARVAHTGVVVALIAAAGLAAEFLPGPDHNVEDRSTPQPHDTQKATPAGPLPGQIVVDPDHPGWFKYQNGGPFFMCGPGDPEDFLYRGTRNPDGTRDGDQAALIDKLAQSRANSIYLIAVRSHGGDGGPLENPFIDGDPELGVSDVILDQWESWFTLMDMHGIVVYFFFYDDSTCLDHPLWNTGDEVGATEGQFIDTLVARFKHHKHLIWCVKEEYSEALSRARAEGIAKRIAAADDHDHPVAIHQTIGTAFDFNGSPFVHQFAAQFSTATAEQLHDDTLAARLDVGGGVNVNVAEFPDAGTGAELRRKLWAIALGGGYAMVFGMDIASTPDSDLRICGDLVHFMESTALTQMSPRDDLAIAGTRYVLADPGHAYVLYGIDADTLGVQIEAGLYDVNWFDPITGVLTPGSAIETSGGDAIFSVPAGFGAEAVLYLSIAATVPLTNVAVAVEIESVRTPVTRDVTFVISDCVHPADVRTVPVAFDASGRGSVIIGDVSAGALWVSAKAGHTLSRLAPIVCEGCGTSAVDFTGAHALRPGDFHLGVTAQDDRVDVVDFLILMAGWGTPIDPEIPEGADANADGRQETADYTAIQINYLTVGDPIDGCGTFAPPSPLAKRD